MLHGATPDAGIGRAPRVKRTSPIARALAFACLLLLPLWPAEVPAAPMSVRYYYTSTDAVRYGYYYELLEAALKASVPNYGPYVIERLVAPVSSKRWNLEGIAGQRINVMWSNVGHPDLNEGMIPIPVPADRGVHGYRVLLIRAERQAEFDRIRNIEDLRRLSNGSGDNWGDLAILDHNRIPSRTAPTYELLLPMLSAGRFDYFSRSVLEAPAEMKAFGSTYPDLAIERRLLLHYRFPVVFFVTRKEARLAERIRFGLETMADNGDLKRLFDRHFEHSLLGLNLSNRRVIELENPDLPGFVSKFKPAWWFDPMRSASPRELPRRAGQAP